jgi:hypothetical protein
MIEYISGRIDREELLSVKSVCADSWSILPEDHPFVVCVMKTMEQLLKGGSSIAPHSESASSVPLIYKYSVDHKPTYIGTSANPYRPYSHLDLIVFYNYEQKSRHTDLTRRVRTKLDNNFSVKLDLEFIETKIPKDELEARELQHVMMYAELANNENFRVKTGDVRNSKDMITLINLLGNNNPELIQALRKKSPDQIHRLIEKLSGYANRLMS